MQIYSNFEFLGVCTESQENLGFSGRVSKYVSFLFHIIPHTMLPFTGNVTQEQMASLVATRLYIIYS